MYNHLTDNCICIVNFNCSHLLALQLDSLERFLPEHNTFIVNTSDIREEIENIRKICVQRKIDYVEVNYMGKNPSDQHGHACNLAYKRTCIPTNYEFFDKTHSFVLFLDHDIFPFKYCNVFNTIQNKTFYGRRWDTDKGITYIWPGFLGVNNNKQTVPIDFMPINGVGDTGVQIHRELDALPSTEIQFAVETHLKFENTGFKLNVCEIYDDTWIHFIKSSNWQKIELEEHTKRTNYLINKLKELQSNAI